MSERKRCVDCEYRYAVGKSPRCTVCKKRRTTRVQHSAHLKARYSITYDEYEYMLKQQGGKCYTCGGGTSKKHLAVDHDHKTGEVRGLLCGTCNGTLRRLRDRAAVAKKMALYLTKPPARMWLDDRDWSKNLEADRKSTRKRRGRR